ncbi:GlcG/HbpS family heme-binding protein [Algihabitans albus]|uniref:GlcG/HbpS family heme-binding protein n=1 Tax=Algihabitans albus TaxID=2164067 RepID=UPI000E5D294A|nr:heme-binding protein [Algihabitans albus]
MTRMFLAAALLAAVAAAPIGAGDAKAEDEALVTFEVLTPELAGELATNTLLACREEGFQVGVAVVDRFGVLQAFLRDRFAGPHTPDTATRKAWTTVSFREDTLDLVEATASGPQSGARDITNALMLGGGVQILVQGRMVGAVGVSGAPGGAEDHACAVAGIASIESQLPF